MMPYEMLTMTDILKMKDQILIDVASLTPEQQADLRKMKEDLDQYARLLNE